MPDLKCSVTKCNYNCTGLCCLGCIDISGGGKKESTCCSSFTDSSGAVSAVSRNFSADKKTEIDCSADDCVYNKNSRCSAPNVDICRCETCHCSPCTCSDTECRTFKKK